MPGDGCGLQLAAAVVARRQAGRARGGATSQCARQCHTRLSMQAGKGLTLLLVKPSATFFLAKPRSTLNWVACRHVLGHNNGTGSWEGSRGGRRAAAAAHSGACKGLQPQRVRGACLDVVARGQHRGPAGLLLVGGDLGGLQAGAGAANFYHTHGGAGGRLAARGQRERRGGRCHHSGARAATGNGSGHVLGPNDWSRRGNKGELVGMRSSVRANTPGWTSSRWPARDTARGCWTWPGRPYSEPGAGRWRR